MVGPVIPLYRRFLVDVVLAGAGILGVLGAVLLAFDGVEHARLLAHGSLSVGGWIAEVLARVPGRLATVAPVATGVASVLVALQWHRTGRLVGVLGCGLSPTRLALCSGLAGLLVGGFAAGLREASLPWTAGQVAADGAWVTVAGPGPGDAVHVRAEVLTGGRAVEVQVAEVANGRLVSRGAARRAIWRDGGWVLDGARALTWKDGRPVTTALDLPDPVTWRRHAVEASADTPLRQLWWSAPSPARAAWLAERWSSILGAAVLALFGLPWVLWDRRSAFLGTVALSATWRLGHGGLLAIAARGGCATWVATALPVLAVLGLACVALWVVGRSLPPGGRGLFGVGFAYSAARRKPE
jgi:lipopolysaccharide export LptBFGC system permease protein LptF